MLYLLVSCSISFSWICRCISRIQGDPRMFCLDDSRQTLMSVDWSLGAFTPEMYPLVMTNVAIGNGPDEIVDKNPLNMMIFQFAM